jgi:hypothetical protein
MPDQKRDIALRCSQLQDKVDTFQQQAGNIFCAVSNNADDSWDNDHTRETYTSAEFDGIGKDKDDSGHDSAAEEHYRMQLPRNSPSDGHIMPSISHCIFSHI